GGPPVLLVIQPQAVHLLQPRKLSVEALKVRDLNLDDYVHHHRATFLRRALFSGSEVGENALTERFDLCDDVVHESGEFPAQGSPLRVRDVGARHTLRPLDSAPVESADLPCDECQLLDAAWLAEWPSRLWQSVIEQSLKVVTDSH